MGITQLGYVGFGVGDMAAWRTLAVDILGLQDGGRGPDGAMYLRMDEFHHRIVLHPSGEDDLLYAGWQLERPGDLEVLAGRLREAGIAVTEAGPEELAHRRVARMVKFRDPDGFPMELYYGPLVPNHEPFVPGRPISGFRTGALGIGHVLGYATDPAKAERFYVDVLGFGVSDYGVTGTVFLHTNPRQHSLGFTRGEPRINHLMIEVTALDDVGRALDLCEENGVPIVTTLGKHNNDQMVSFYLETPSGFHLEYGWGGRLIGKDWVVQVNEKGDLWGHKRVRQADREGRRVDPAKARFPWLIRKGPGSAYH